MNKALKIAGILIGVLILIVIFLRVTFGVLNDGITPSSNVSLKIPSSTEPFKDSVSGISYQGMSTPMSVGDGATRQEYEKSPNDTSVATPGTVTDKKVIKNGNLSLRVDSVDKASEKISEIARNNEGEVFSSNFSQHGTNAKSGVMTVKVPVKNFEKTFGEIKKVAIIVNNESTTGQDVTEQYTDLQAQMKNKQAEEQSYVKLLDQAQKMDDILAITRQLSATRGEIERIQSKIRYMDSQTDMSTISASLSEDTSVTIVDSWRPWQVVKESVRELIKSVQGWIDFIIRLIIKVIPVLFLYGIIIYIFYRIGRWIYFKFKSKDSVQK